MSYTYDNNYHFETIQLHAGQENPDPATDARAVPIYQTTSFVFKNSAHAAARFALADAGNIYGRLTNSTVDAFEQRIAALEGGVAALGVASGAAAINYTFLNLASAGDNIVSAKTIYGGAYNLLEHTLPQYGITATFVDPDEEGAFENAINDKTKAVFIETIGNPNATLIDIEKVAAIAHAHKIPLILDNTTATAYLFQGLKHGADIVVNSSSKYINGSSNSISGILTYSGRFQWDPQMYPQIAAYKKFGPMAYIARLRNSLFRDTGACLAPMNAYLNLIGMETLGLRMERQCSNALELAQWLEETYPSVTVNYPGLKSSNWYEISEKQFSRGYGAILTLRVGSKENAFALIDALKIPYTLSNIGDTKTLVIHPGSTISLHSSEQEKEDAGVFEDLIRVSVGIEDIEDLKADFAQAIEKIGQR